MYKLRENSVLYTVGRHVCYCYYILEILYYVVALKLMYILLLHLSLYLL